MSEVHNVNINITSGTLAPGTTNVFGFWAPTASVGGGITITKVSYASNNAVAAASAPNFTLVTVGTNSATNGTIATAIGSVAFAAGTIQTGTISSAFVDATYGVAVQWVQTEANADRQTINAHVQYVLGR
jgi:hypothetical protein